MKRFLLVPTMALAIVTFAAPANAQAADPAAEVREVTREVIQNRNAVDRIDLLVNQCQVPDSEQIAALMATANDLSRRAAAVAPLVPGMQHVQALNLQSIAETNFWRLQHPPVADQCYVPPSE